MQNNNRTATIPLEEYESLVRLKKAITQKNIFRFYDGWSYFFPETISRDHLIMDLVERCTVLKKSNDDCIDKISQLRREIEKLNEPKPKIRLF